LRKDVGKLAPSERLAAPPPLPPVGKGQWRGAWGKALPKPRRLGGSEPHRLTALGDLSVAPAFIGRCDYVAGWTKVAGKLFLGEGVGCPPPPVAWGLGNAGEGSDW